MQLSSVLRRLLSALAFRVMVATVAASVAFGAMANGSATNVTVSQLYIDSAYGNVLYVKLSAPPTGSCGSNTSWHFAVSLDDTVGKNIYSQLLTAFASGAVISTMIGTGSCNGNGVEITRAVVLQR
jgi:hypothetical protein